MTERSLLIKGGTVYAPGGPVPADVLVRDGRIEAVGHGLGAGVEEAEVLEARGLWVLPGAIDAHVHSRDPGLPEKEDFGTLTAAAAAGGVTTVIDMPNTIPGVDSAPVLQEKAEIASARALVDFGLWGLVRSGSQPEDLEALAGAGAIGFKAFLGYAFHRGRRQVLQTFELDDPELEAPPDYGTVARLGPSLAALGLPLAVHCEDLSVLREFARPVTTYAEALAARPAAAEAVAIAALSALAAGAGFRLHVVHLSSAEGLAAARSGGVASLETCPQYLWFTDRDHERLGSVLKMYPLVRTAADRDALVLALLGGEIATVGTDHAPHTDAEKSRQLDEAAAGAPGVQTLYLSCLELARRHGDPWVACLWVSENPAKRLGLHPRKGAVVAGADADLVLVDPQGETVVRAGDMLSRQRHGLFEGVRFGFAVKQVLVRGRRPAAGVGKLVRPA